MAFSASDAAFEGFRLARERPVAILLWAAIFLVFNLVSGAVLIGMAGAALAEFMEIGQAGAAADPQRFLGIMAALAPAYGVITLLSLAVYGVLFAAVTRAVLRPAESAAGYLRLGRDELRQFLVLLLLCLASLAVYVAIVTVISIVAAVAGAVSGAAMALISVLGVVATALALFWLWGRLALAGPMTLDTGRLSLKESWAMTRGRGWTMFGALFLAAVLSMIVGLLCLLIFTAVAAVAFGGLEAATAVFSPDFSSLADYFSPVMIIYNAFVAVVYALTLAIVVGVGARAYAELRGSTAA